MAAVLEHMSSLCAITMPQAESYARVIDDSWTGGTWIAWGTENREVPLRKSDANRWEIRCLDGFANMYLALVAIFAIGLKGVQDGKEMTMKDCKGIPFTFRHMNAVRADLPILQQIPPNYLKARKRISESRANCRRGFESRSQLRSKIKSSRLPCLRAC